MLVASDHPYSTMILTFLSCFHCTVHPEQWYNWWVLSITGPYCEFIANTKGGLVLHMRKHSAASTRSLTCDVCHQDYFVDFISTWTYQLCQVTFSTAYFLKKHIRAQHAVIEIEPETQVQQPGPVRKYTRKRPLVKKRHGAGETEATSKKTVRMTAKRTKHCCKGQARNNFINWIAHTNSILGPHCSFESSAKAILEAHLNQQHIVKHPFTCTVG